jgi:signal peptidase I
VSATTPHRRSRAFSGLIEVVTTVVLAIVLFFVIQTFVVQTFQVKMDSMEPTFQPDQHLLVDKLTPRFDDYSRGDVIVFHPPTGQRRADSSTCANGSYDDSATPYIKRVIGVAGDHVEVRAGGVWINGVRLNESYISPDGNTDPLTALTSWDVPTGCLFVLGDHRSVSQDSRVFGLIQSSEVIGRAWLRFYPIDTLGLLQTPTYPELPTP